MRMLPVQTSQKERHFHENEHDGRHKYDEILNQDNDNQDGMRYSLKTHKEKTGNLIYEYDMCYYPIFDPHFDKFFKNKKIKNNNKGLRVAIT